VKELKGFIKVDLKPGEEKAATVSLNRRSFAYYDVTGKQWKIVPGEFTIFVGSSSEKMELVGKVSLTNSSISTLADGFEPAATISPDVAVQRRETLQ